MAKFITAKEAAELIPDGATVAVAGLGVSGWAEEIGCAIRDRYKETGHPKNLYLKQGSAMGDHGYGNNFLGWDKQPLPEGMEKPAGVRGTSRLGEAGEGLVTRWTGAHVMSADALNALAAQGKITGNCVPQGVAVNLWREIAAGRPGLLTKVGLGTFIDPRLEGGRMNKETQEDAAELVTFGGEELTGRYIKKGNSTGSLSEMDGSQEVILLIIQNVIIDRYTGGNQLGNTSFHQFLRQFRVFQLVTDSYTLSGTNQFRKICIKRMMGKSCHLDSLSFSIGAFCQCDS